MIGGLFVDGPNLAASLIRKGGAGSPRRIDFAAFPKVLSRVLYPTPPAFVDFQFKCYYGGFRHERDQMRKKDFVAMLGRLGYVVHESETKELRDKKTDIAVALDAYKLAVSGQVGALAVVTHDSDFSALFKRLPISVRRVVVGWRDEIANEILEVAEPVYMDEILADVAYRP